MNSFTFLTVIALAFLFNLSTAQIPSFGLQTAAGIRGLLEDKEFAINPENGIRINTPNFRVRIADLTNFPALAGQDVQSQIVRVNLKSQQMFIPHYHPRGSETLNAIRGTFKVTFTFEGLNPRTVVNTIKAGESTVFPQGLPHTTTCISKQDCIFLSVFNSADPGLIPVTL